MKKLRKLWAAVLSAALLVTCMPAMTARADLGGWTTDANGIMTITGTDITVRYANNTIYIEGSGAIPDYTPATYTMRPWHYLDFEYVWVSDGITEIGSYAFADKTKIKQVSLSAATFVKDGTAFSGLGGNTILRVRGTAGTTRQYGTLTYSSLESIAANAPNASQCMFIMDSYEAAQQFRGLAYPYLQYVYSATDTSAPWQTKTDTTASTTFNKVCSISASNSMGTLTGVSAQVRPQGAAYMESISSLLGNDTYVRSYNITVSDSSGIIYGTNSVNRYVLYLQPQDQIAIRQYYLIEMGADGQWYKLQDLDSDCATVTFATFYPTSTYALVYQYNADALTAIGITIY